MMNQKEAHALFGECWKMLNAVRKSKWTNTGWEQCAETAREIYKKEGNSVFSKQIIFAVLDEADRLEAKKEKGKEEYLLAHQIFQAAWEFFVDVRNDLDDGKRLQQVYIEKYNKHPFAISLSAAVLGLTVSNVQEGAAA